MRLIGVGIVLPWCLYALACASVQTARSQEHSGNEAGTVESTQANDAPTSGNDGLAQARIRRLTNAEYDATVQALLGTELRLGEGFVPDARLHKYAKFDRNEAQVIDPVLAGQLQHAAQQLAAEYVVNQLPQVSTCASMGDEVCAREFFRDFLPKALRRVDTATELEDLLTAVVLPSLSRDGFALAVQLGIEAVLQSSAFLYHTELGGQVDAQFATLLTNDEIANAIAYLITGAPPDAALEAAAHATDVELRDAGVREAHVRRLLQTEAAKLQVQRAIKQWLGIDQVQNLLKDGNKFADFSGLRRAMARETDDFVAELVFLRNAGFRTLMSADYTIGGADLATLYGVSAPESEPGVIDLRSVPRRGLLNQAAFLAVNASPVSPSPVKRGVRFLTQVLCIDPGDPAQLMINIAPPSADNTRTTRQRFEQHNAGSCASCHAMIDSLGFAFEHFNAMGAWESNEDGLPELPIDSTTTLALPNDVALGDQTVADSAELALLVSESDAGRRCFARNLARFTLATYDADIEQAFVDAWQRLENEERDTVFELLVAFVRLDEFITRRAPTPSSNGGGS